MPASQNPWNWPPRPGSRADSTATRTMAAYLASWLAGKNSLRPSTYTSYAGHVRMYLVPHLGTVLLVDLRAEQIELMYRKIMAETVTSPRPISLTTLKRIHSTLTSALGTAVRRGMIDRNPASTVELPRPSPRKATAWTGEEFGQFLRGIETDPLYLVYMILGLRGLRRGEAVALRWANVDLDEGILRIEESAVVVSGRTILGPPKSAAGRRIVTIDTGTVELLRAHQAAQEQTRGLIGSPITPSADQDWVFANPDGSPLDSAYVSRRFDQLVVEVSTATTRGLEALEPT